MKLVLLSIILITISRATAQTCCDAPDKDPPNVSNRSPSAWTVFPANQVITFKAYVDDLCGLASTYINIYGYAINGHVASVTPSLLCPPGYLCLDYSFPKSGQNWWSITAVDACGNTRIVANSTFCIESCPRNLRAVRDELQHIKM